MLPIMSMNGGAVDVERVPVLVQERSAAGARATRLLERVGKGIGRPAWPLSPGAGLRRQPLPPVAGGLHSAVEVKDGHTEAFVDFRSHGRHEGVSVRCRQVAGGMNGGSHSYRDAVMEQLGDSR